MTLTQSIQTINKLSLFVYMPSCQVIQSGRRLSQGVTSNNHVLDYQLTNVNSWRYPPFFFYLFISLTKKLDDQQEFGINPTLNVTLSRKTLRTKSHFNTQNLPWTPNITTTKIPGNMII